MLKKIIYITIFIVASVVFCAAGILYYYYTHPDAVASLIKGSISRSMNVSVNINNLSYSINPLRILAEGIRLTPSSSSSGFFIDIPRMAADFSFTGPFGRRTLVADMIEIEGVSLKYNKTDFRLELKTAPSEAFWGWFLKRGVSFFIFRNVRFEAVRLTDGNVTANLNGPIFSANSVSIHRRANNRIEWDSTARFQWSDKGVDVSIPEFHISTHHAISLSKPIMETRISAKKMVVRSTVTKLSDVDLKTEGHLDFNRHRIRLDGLTVSVSKYIRLLGSLEIDYSPESNFKVTVHSSAFSPEYIRSILPDGFKKTLPPVDVGGMISVKGGLDAMQKGNDWKWDFRLKSRLSKNRLAYKTEHERMSGTISGSMEILGNLSDVNISADLEMKGSEFSSKSLRVKSPDIRFSVSGKHPVYQIRNASVRISSAHMLKSEKGMVFKDIRCLLPYGSIDIDKRTYRFQEIQMDSPFTGKIKGMMETDGKGFHMEVEGKETRLLASLREYKLLPLEWQFSGRDSISIDTTLRKGNTLLTFDSRIHLEEFQAQDPTGRFAGENLSIEVVTKGELNLDGGAFTGEADLKLTNGEILYDLFYLNLNENKITATAQVFHDDSMKELGLTAFDLKLNNVLSLSATGSLKYRKPFPVHLSIQLPANPLPPIFRMFLAEPFGREMPYLENIKLDGHVSTDLDWKGAGGDWSVKGGFSWRDGSISMNHGEISAVGIDMVYPVWYQTRTVHSESKPLAGTVSIESLSLPSFPKQTLKSAINAKPNRIWTTAPIHIRLPKGSIVAGPITIRNMYTSDAMGETSIRVNRSEFYLPKLKIWPQSIPAAIGGGLHRVSIGRDRINAKGTLVVEAFGGRTVLSGLSVDRYLSPSPLVRLDAEFEDLQLGQLTKDTNIGRIDGILRGYVNKLEIAYGQPQHFDLLLETEKRKKIRQQISIQAIDTIARVGGGQSPFVGFSAIFSSFFKTFNYEKIGIRSTLKNDMIRINGTIIEDRREYLMKGSALAGVNIINQNPNNRIRFKDMIKRIKRVTKGGKPVIR